MVLAVTVVLQQESNLSDVGWHAPEPKAMGVVDSPVHALHKLRHVPPAALLYQLAALLPTSHDSLPHHKLTKRPRHMEIRLFSLRIDPTDPVLSPLRSFPMTELGPIDPKFDRLAAAG